MGNRQIRNRPVLARASTAGRTREIMDKDPRGRGRWDVSMGALGRGPLGLIAKVLGAAWDRIKGNTAACFTLALLFSAVFVVPPVMIFGNRDLPFEHGLVYAKTEELRAGETGTIVFTVKNRSRKCRGEFNRYFTDAEGNRFFLGTFRTSYQQGLKFSESGRSFEKDWAVPLGAKPGPGLYETEPYFWCNWFQQAYPIAAKPVTVKVWILPPKTLGSLNGSMYSSAQTRRLSAKLP